MIRQLAVKLAYRLEIIAVNLREKFDRCDICGNEVAKQECPCGKRVCDECADFYMYSDENCCKSCAADIRQIWKDCPEHKFGESEENEDGHMIEQCERCAYPQLVGASEEKKDA